MSEINGETTIDSSSEDDELDSSSVSNSKACEAFNTALKWLEAQTDIDPVHLLLVKKWRDIAARKWGENLKQNTISSYFIKQWMLNKYTSIVYCTVLLKKNLSYGQFLRYRHPLVPHRPDKGGFSVYDFKRQRGSVWLWTTWAHTVLFLFNIAACT